MASPIEPRSLPEETRLPSERSFGLVFTAFFLLVGCWPLLHGQMPKPIPLILAAVFAVLAFAMPAVLRPLNIVWAWIGHLLHKIVSPLVMGAVFFLCMTPIGLLMRVLGKRPMALERDPGVASYWIVRDPPGPAPETLRNQF